MIDQDEFKSRKVSLVTTSQDLFHDLHQSGRLVENTWRRRQSDLLDRRTKFVYRCETLDELEERAKALTLSEEEHSYALHRWRNFRRHEAWMQLLRERVEGLHLSTNRFDKTCDFELRVGDRWISFDLKVTRFPQAVGSQVTNPELALWFYRNQSREQRFHLANRLFVVGHPEMALYDFALACQTVEDFAADVDGYCFPLPVGQGRTAASIILRQTWERAA